MCAGTPEYSRARSVEATADKEPAMIRLTLVLSFASMLVGCAYPTQQAMIEVPNPTTMQTQIVDPVCDNPVERAESADLIGDAGEDLICALTEKLDPR
jgi:hypothetical protein